MAEISLSDVAKFILEQATAQTTDTRDVINKLAIHQLDLSKKVFIKELQKVKSYIEQKSKLVANSKVLDGVTSEDLADLIEVVSASKVKKDVRTDVTFSTLNTAAANYKDSLLVNVGDEAKKAKYRAILTNLQLGHDSSSALTEKYKADIAALNAMLNEVKDSSSPDSIKQKATRMLVASIQQLRLSLVASTTIDKNKIGDIGDAPTIANAIDFFNRKISYLSKGSFAKFTEDYLPEFLSIDMLKNVKTGDMSITVSMENWLDNGFKGRYANSVNEATKAALYQVVQSGLDNNQIAKFKAYLTRTQKDLLSTVSKVVQRDRVKLLIIAQKELEQKALDITNSPSFKTLLLNSIEEAILGKSKSASVVLGNKTARSKSIRNTTSVSNSIITPIVKPNSKAPLKPSLRNTKGQFTSLTNIESLIRARLTETIKKNMTKPALVNRTGRFAESVKLQSIDNRQGTLVAFLSYMKYPYATFEPGNLQGSVHRNPRTLIDRSVREIAKSIVTTRLKTVIV